jgi:hypothetical protein
VSLQGCTLLYAKEQAMLILRNIEARSRNQCCRWKPISKTYFECMSVALVYSVYIIIYFRLWSENLYHILPHYLINNNELKKQPEAQ